MTDRERLQRAGKRYAELLHKFHETQALLANEIIRANRAEIEINKLRESRDALIEVYFANMGEENFPDAA